MADSDGATILHISETKFFPTTFPFNASIGGETVQVTGYESTGLGNGGNKDAQGNFVISVHATWRKRACRVPPPAR